MAREALPQVLTANDLHLGDVVYRGASNTWVRNIADAVIYHDQLSAEEALNATAGEKNIVVGVYLFDVLVENGVPRPAHFREDFRARGPGNYHHGKQEDGHV